MKQFHVSIIYKATGTTIMLQWIDSISWSLQLNHTWYMAFKNGLLGIFEIIVIFKHIFLALYMKLLWCLILYLWYLIYYYENKNISSNNKNIIWRWGIVFIISRINVADITVHNWIDVI